MTFFVFILVCIGLIAGIFATSSNPGIIHIKWLGYDIEASITLAFLVAIGTLLFLALILSMFYKVRFYIRTYHYRRQIKLLNQQLEDFLKCVVHCDLKNIDSLEKSLQKTKLPFPYKTFCESKKESLFGQTTKRTLALSRLLDHPLTAPYAIVELADLMTKQGRFEEIPYLISKILEIEDIPAFSIKPFYELALKHQFFAEAQLLLKKIERKMSRDDKRYMEALYYVEQGKHTNSPKEQFTCFEKAFDLYSEASSIAVPYLEGLRKQGEVKKVLKRLKHLWPRIQSAETRKIALDVIAEFPMVQQMEYVEDIIRLIPHSFESQMLVIEVAMHNHLWGKSYDCLEKLMTQHPSLEVFNLKQKLDSLQKKHNHDYQQGFAENMGQSLLKY
jgi:predicted oxidoreductase (fatty acid repression mutant protein)/uncharacterized membrane protein YciS (DUF1049 family)